MGKHEEFWTTYTRYMRLGAQLHKARPGDGAYNRNRLHIYTGLASTVIDDTAYIGHSWKGWCGRCGTEIFQCYGTTVEADRSTPAVILGLDMPNFRRDNPAFLFRQRCRECHRPTGRGKFCTMNDLWLPMSVGKLAPPLPAGYSPAARRVLQEAKLPLDVMERENSHYRFYDRDTSPIVLLTDAERDTHRHCTKLLRRALLVG